jgi:hypothetical protein
MIIGWPKGMPRSVDTLMKLSSKSSLLNKIIRQAGNRSQVEVVNFIESYHKKRNWPNRVAYLAGLVDGEGYFQFRKDGQIRLRIGMTDKAAIFWIKDNFGGSVIEQKTAKGRPFYVWHMNQGASLVYLILLLIPFLITKKDIAVTGFKNLIDTYASLHHTLGDYVHREKI